MATFRHYGSVGVYGQKFVEGMVRRGYDAEFAERCFHQIEGFGSYGFPESHAVSFAKLVYVSSWIKHHYPDVFGAALLNSQPMGFYQPAQIVRDAQAHGVTVRPVDVNFSRWDCALEGESAGGDVLRLGMRLVGGLREADVRKIEAAVEEHGRYCRVVDLWRASGVRVQTLRTLASADAFGSMGLDRQMALWTVGALRDQSLPMFDGLADPVLEEASVPLPQVSPVTRVVYDYAATGLSLKAHPLSFSRQQLSRHRVIPTGELADERRSPHGRKVAVAGLALIRQRPATASGILFMTIEDETGIANLVIRPAVYERWYRALRHSVAIVAWGKVERQGQVVHVLVERAANLSSLTRGGEVKTVSRDFH